jgi:hypothetical protein
MATFVYAIAQVFARLEMRHVLAGQSDRFASLWISSDTGWTVMEGETPKATYFDALTLGQRIAHQVKQMLHGQLNILGWQVFLLPGNGFYQF